jgi:hypothetical protein
VLVGESYVESVFGDVRLRHLYEECFERNLRLGVRPRVDHALKRLEEGRSTVRLPQEVLREGADEQRERILSFANDVAINSRFVFPNGTYERGISSLFKIASTRSCFSSVNGHEPIRVRCSVSAWRISPASPISAK